MFTDAPLSDNNGMQGSDYYKVKTELLRCKRRGTWVEIQRGFWGFWKLQGYSLYDHSSNYTFILCDFLNLHFSFYNKKFFSKVVL